MILRRLALVLLASAPAGCATNTCDMTREIEVAGTIGTASHLARCINQDLHSAAAVPDADKAELRARAEILEAHASQLRTSLDRYNPDDPAAKSITIENLQARAAALDAEFRSTYHEWTVWQVAHGVRRADETFQLFDYSYDLK